MKVILAPGFNQGGPLTVTGQLGICITLGVVMELVASPIQCLITKLAIFNWNGWFRNSLTDKNSPVFPMTWNIIKGIQIWSPCSSFWGEMDTIFTMATRIIWLFRRKVESKICIIRLVFKSGEIISILLWWTISSAWHFLLSLHVFVIYPNPYPATKAVSVQVRGYCSDEVLPFKDWDLSNLSLLTIAWVVPIQIQSNQDLLGSWVLWGFPPHCHRSFGHHHSSWFPDATCSNSH